MNDRLLATAKRLINSGINQKVLAAKLGIPASTFSKWLNGRTDWAPDVRTLDRLVTLRSEVVSAFDEQETPARSDPTTAGGLQRTGTDPGANGGRRPSEK